MEHHRFSRTSLTRLSDCKENLERVAYLALKYSPYDFGISETLRTTGASVVLATSLVHLAASLPPWGAVALILVAAMAVTPFLNNAATVLVMAPIAAVFAHDLGYRPEAFLIGTAIGAGCDFLTPIGHQCNTLVFGPGGYRFSDYARLGAPLSVLVVLVGTPLVMWTWPLH